MLGLAATAALLVMAFDASLAMAETTSLCDTDPGTGAHEVCPAGHLPSHVHKITKTKAKLLVGSIPYPSRHVHEATATGKKAKLLTTFLTVECDVLFLGLATPEGEWAERLKSQATSPI